MSDAHFVPLETGYCAAVVRSSRNLLGRVEFMLDWLRQWLKYERKGRSGVVVFDIDDTLIFVNKQPIFRADVRHTNSVKPFK